MKRNALKLKCLSLILLGLLLACLSLPASAYTVYKTVAFGPDQAGQTVTFAIKNAAGVAVTSGVSGTVYDLGGGAVVTTTLPFRLGYWGGSQPYYLDGALDGWGTWSRSLSLAEIISLYNGGAGKDYPFS